MHVAINGFFWQRPFVGSGQYTRQLVYHLNRFVSDLNITLILPKSETPPQDVPPSVNIQEIAVREGNVGKVYFEQILFPRACREIGADLAHVPYWGSPLRSPIPVVVTVHDLTTMLVPEYRRGFKARLYNALVGASARGASHVITDSFSSKIDIMDKLHIPEEKVTAVYLAASSEFSPKGNDLLDMAVMRKYDLPDFYILYLGGYELHKNVITLLHAFTYVAQALGEDYPLVLAGKKPTAVSAIYPDYEDYIRRSNLEKFVKWIGFVDEEDKAVLYRNAETFVFPSRYEGFGLPPLEALASGCPVVSSNASSLPEVIGGAGFAIDPDDERNMAGAIISTIMQDSMAAELRQKGPEQAAKFSWEATAQETLQVYDRVLRTV